MSVHVSSLYQCYHYLLTGSVLHGSTTLSTNTIKLQLLEIFGFSYQQLCAPVMQF